MRHLEHRTTAPADLDQQTWTHLEEGAAGLHGTGEVVGVGAAQSVAATGGAGVLAVGAAQRQTSSQRQLHVDQGAGLRLVHLTGPQGAVEVHLETHTRTHRSGTCSRGKLGDEVQVVLVTHPQVQVQVEEAGRSVCPSVPLLVAEAAAALVPGQRLRT